MTLGNMDNVELFDAGKKGRGLRAARDLNAGEVVFSEPSFSAVVFDSLSTQVCHNCFRRQANLHRCAQCKFAHYCDRTCQTACWDEHRQECGAIKKLGTAPTENVRLAARVLWRVQKETGVVSDGQLISVVELQEHVARLSEPQLKELKMDVQNFLKFWPQSGKQHTADHIAHIFGIISCNGFTLSDQRGLQAVGVGLFPNLCLVNHECYPNCTVILNHGSQSAVDSALHSKRRIELRALGRIPEGKELTVSYVDFLNISTDRQRTLRQQYHFDCSCTMCIMRTKDDLMTGVKVGKNGSDETESGTGSTIQPSEKLVKEAIAFTMDCMEKIETCRTEGNFQEVVRMCRECLEKQESLLQDTHLIKLRVLSIASEVSCFLRLFSEAADYARRMVEGYTKLYQPNNAQLGMAMMRAGVTHWHAGQIEIGHGLICKAYAILMITHGSNHPITRDLEAMRTQTEAELHMFKQNEHVYHSMREAALKHQR